MPLHAHGVLYTRQCVHIGYKDPEVQVAQTAKAGALLVPPEHFRQARGKKDRKDKLPNFPWIPESQPSNFR